jgi:pimeloyl-ACP methyl ester carboxylesterase
MNDPIERAVAALFVGDRSELTASAAAAAGHPVTLPQQFVLAGHSAGGNLVAAAAGYIADAGAAGNLKGVILFDAAHDGDASTGMAKLSGENAVPVMLIAAPPCSCNNSGANTNTTINSAPDNFVAVMLAGGSHLDAEGSSTDWLGILGCGPAPTPQNAAAVQTITAAWINDVFTGSQTGIYAPAGTVVAVNGATATVLAVKGQLLSQSATTA